LQFVASVPQPAQNMQTVIGKCWATQKVKVFSNSKEINYYIFNDFFKLTIVFYISLRRTLLTQLWKTVFPMHDFWQVYLMECLVKLISKIISIQRVKSLQILKIFCFACIWRPLFWRHWSENIVFKIFEDHYSSNVWQTSVKNIS